MADLQGQIEELWERRTSSSPATSPPAALVREAVDLLDSGEARVAEVVGGRVVVHEWLKQAILLLFRLSQMETIELGPFEYADKIPLKRGSKPPGCGSCPGPRPARARSSSAAS